MIKVSVVIPVYNCEKYIENNIRSVQEQTMQELEIICVNDGSMDRSTELIRNLQAKDERIVLFNQNNQGPGAARNLGMQYARGEFIAFLDADDYYKDRDALESMYCKCKENGVSVCGTNIRIKRGEKLVPEKGYQDVIEASEKSDVLLYQDFQFDYGYYGFIFEKKLIINKNLQFPLYRRFEDPVFFVKTMYAAKHFCFMNKALYVYRAPNVMMRFHKSNTEDLLHGLLDNLRFAAEHSLQKLFIRTIKRVEEEYMDIICHNLNINNLDIMLRINKMIGIYTKKSDYIIKPLQNILNSLERMENDDVQALKNKLFNYERIYPYGAGKACVDFLKYLEKKDLLQKVTHILVTDLKDNPASVRGIPVMSVEDYQVQGRDLVMITVGGIHQKDVMSVLEKKDVYDYVVLNSKLCSVMFEEGERSQCHS